MGRKVKKVGKFLVGQLTETLSQGEKGAEDALQSSGAELV